MEGDTAFRVTLNMRSIRLTDDQLSLLCRDNPDLRFELSAHGELMERNVECVENAGNLSGEDVRPGFQFNFQKILKEDGPE